MTFFARAPLPPEIDTDLPREPKTFPQFAARRRAIRLAYLALALLIPMLVIRLAVSHWRFESYSILISAFVAILFLPFVWVVGGQYRKEMRLFRFGEPANGRVAVFRGSVEFLTFTISSAEIEFSISGKRQHAIVSLYGDAKPNLSPGQDVVVLIIRSPLLFGVYTSEAGILIGSKARDINQAL